MNCADFVDLSSDDDHDVEIVGWSKPLQKDYDENGNIEKVAQKHPHFGDFIKSCLEVEDSKGMMRVINRSLLPLYNEAKPDFLNSVEFKTILLKTEKNIKGSCRFKFSFIKSVCEVLKKNKRKRAKLTTLESSSRKKNKFNCHNENVSSNVIDLEKLEHYTEERGIILLDESKENMTVNNSILTCSSTLDVKKDEKTANSPEDKLLIAHRVEMIDIEDNSKTRIEFLNAEIAKIKRLLDVMEQAEVDEDSNNSPYVKSEVYKRRILDLYRQLCVLTESSPVKQHKVSLKVLEGHAEEPVQILEHFLNNNMQSNGYPVFPDFNDVKICVVLANDMYKLNWPPSQVVSEARSLFTQCGRALQKLRQEREWRDLISHIKEENCEVDPADLDSELRAKLEANKQRAITNEDAIIRRYAEMQEKSTEIKKHTITSKTVVQDVEVSDSKSETTNEDFHDNNIESECDSVILCEDDDTEEIFERLRNTIQAEKPKPSQVKTEMDLDGNSDIEPEAITNIVKQEREPLSKLLAELGDNFTTTIVEIQDPFLIVELSDSSDDDDEVTFI
ncbi:unnamed protein product [Leptosia nina]|uniref:Daxx histone-binding domain-containing protein n=1 Tax=Leptosia nina TaxID=320188 RepID=A0AAV1K471_9NEOP